MRNNRDVNITPELGSMIKKAQRVVLTEPEGFKGKLREFQKVGVAWLYATPKGILADLCGFGKTIQVLGLLSLLKSRGELPFFVIVVEPEPALTQWAKEVGKFTDLNIAVMAGGPRQRKMTYSSCGTAFGPDGLLITYPIVLRDYKLLIRLGIKVYILDEGSNFRNHDTLTAKTIKFLTEDAERVVVLSATPIQNGLLDLHSIMEALHVDVLPNVWDFRTRYIDDMLIEGVKDGRRYRFRKILGYYHVDEFRRLVEPFILRRTMDDVDVDLPDLVVRDVWLDMFPRQRFRYSEVRDGLVEKWGQMSRVEAMARMHYLQQACDTAHHFGDDDISSKLDWICSFVRGLGGRKAIIYSRYLDTIHCLCRRLKDIGVGHRIIIGSVSKVERAGVIQEFWDDEECQVLIGTSAIGTSLNLQCSAFMIGIDQFYNPARTEQLVGRIRRIGSVHSKVVLINLLCRGTVEERIQTLLEQKQALPDYLFGETSDLFNALSKEELFSLIRP